MPIGYPRAYTDDRSLGLRDALGLTGVQEVGAGSNGSRFAPYIRT